MTDYLNSIVAVFGAYVWWRYGRLLWSRPRPENGFHEPIRLTLGSWRPIIWHSGFFRWEAVGFFTFIAYRLIGVVYTSYGTLHGPGAARSTWWGTLWVEFSWVPWGLFILACLSGVAAMELLARRAREGYSGIERRKVDAAATQIVGMLRKAQTEEQDRVVALKNGT